MTTVAEIVRFFAPSFLLGLLGYSFLLGVIGYYLGFTAIGIVVLGWLVLPAVREIPVVMRALHGRRTERRFCHDPSAPDPRRLAAWNSPDVWRERRALRAADQLKPSVSKLAGDYAEQVVVHATCDGRALVVIVAPRTDAQSEDL